MLFVSLILGILSVTDVQQHKFMCPKHTDDDTSSSDFPQSAGPGRCTFVVTGFIQCCKVINNVVPFPQILGCVFFKGATSLVLQ